MIFQGPSLLAPLTVSENVALPLILGGHADATRACPRRGGARRPATRPSSPTSCPRRSPAARRSGSPSPAPWPVSHSLILADEPTGQLDAASGAAVIEVLLEASRRIGAGLVVSTHDPAVADAAARLAGRSTTASSPARDPAGRMIALTWLRGLIAHRPARVLATAFGVAVGVALIAVDRDLPVGDHRRG